MVKIIDLESGAVLSHQPTPGTLGPSEPHPAAMAALVYVQSLGLERLTLALESYASCALEGNRLGEVCGETLRRVLHGQPVSDRYILGLAWALAGVGMGIDDEA